MLWKEKGFILKKRRYGENSSLVEGWTRDHGRVAGLVRGSGSVSLCGVLLPGNSVYLTWRGRSPTHLGVFTVEQSGPTAAILMSDPFALAGLSVLNDLVRLLPERDTHYRLFELYAHILNAMRSQSHWIADIVRFELATLREMGFGLDLRSCAATGQKDDLVYVSPKSGRAVSQKAGAPYHDRLIPLPSFLINDSVIVDDPAVLLQGFNLTAFFMDRHIYTPRRLQPSHMREVLVRKYQVLP